MTAHPSVPGTFLMVLLMPSQVPLNNGMMHSPSILMVVQSLGSLAHV